MRSRFKAFIGGAPLKLLAIVLFSILIPSVLVTSLGLVTVFQSEKYVSEHFRQGVQEAVDVLHANLAEVWSRRLATYRLFAESAASRVDHVALSELRRKDPMVHEVAVEIWEGRSSELLRIDDAPPRLAWTPGAARDLQRLGELEGAGDTEAVLAEAERLLSVSPPDAVRVEALLSAARAAAKLDRFEDANRWFQWALDSYGHTIDETGVVRAIPILDRLLELHIGDVRPRQSGQLLHEMRLALNQYRDHLGGGVFEFYSKRWRELAKGAGVASAKLSDTRVQVGPFSDQEWVRISEALRAERSTDAPPFRDDGVNTRGLELGVVSCDVVTLPFSRGRLHLLLDRGEVSREAGRLCHDLGLAADDLSLVAANARENDPSRGVISRLFVSEPLRQPLAHLRLRYFADEGRVPARFSGFNVLSLATFTWSVVVLVLAIIGGAFFVFWHVVKELRTARLKTDFVSFISHELKTPLTSIRMYTETLIADRVDNQEERNYCLQLIEIESERLTKLIDQILEYSKIQQHQKEFQFASCNLEDVVNEAVRLFDEHTRDTPREVEVNAVQRLSKIKLDRASMIELILNLLTNAAKYSKPEKKIVVNLRESIDDISVEVVDHGVGIRKRDQKRIFDKFYRADDYLTRDVDGTGLGLAFAKYIAKVHNGDIRVTSQVNGGSVFTLQLRKTALFAE